jgi:predicted kinase
MDDYITHYITMFYNSLNIYEYLIYYLILFGVIFCIKMVYDVCINTNIYDESTLTFKYKKYLVNINDFTQEQLNIYEELIKKYIKNGKPKKKPEEQKLIIVGGTFGSGKSTYVHCLYKNKEIKNFDGFYNVNTKIIKYMLLKAKKIYKDDINFDDYELNKEVYTICKIIMSEITNKKYSIIIEDTLLHIDLLDNCFGSLIKIHSISKKALIYINIDTDEAVRRNRVKKEKIDEEIIIKHNNVNLKSDLFNKMLSEFKLFILDNTHDDIKYIDCEKKDIIDFIEN